MKNKWDSDKYEETTWQGKRRDLKRPGLGVWWTQSCFPEVGHLRRWLSGEKEYSRDPWMQYPEAGVCLDCIFELFWKHVFFLALFVEDTILDIPCSLFAHASNARPHPPMLSDLILATAGAWEPRGRLTGRKGQGYPVPLLVSCSGSALLTLEYDIWAPLEYLPRPLRFLITAFNPGSLHALDHTC